MCVKVESLLATTFCRDFPVTRAILLFMMFWEVLKLQKNDHFYMAKYSTALILYCDVFTNDNPMNPQKMVLPFA